MEEAKSKAGRQRSIVMYEKHLSEHRAWQSKQIADLRMMMINS